MKFLQDSDSDDPMLSVVNLIDIFLVIIAALLVAMAQNPLMAAMGKSDVTVVTDAGTDRMEMLVKKGDKVERFKSNGQSGEGEGAKAGVAYRMKDGSVVYVPETHDPAEPGATAASVATGSARGAATAAAAGAAPGTR